MLAAYREPFIQGQLDDVPRPCLRKLEEKLFLNKKFPSEISSFKLDLCTNNLFCFVTQKCRKIILSFLGLIGFNFSCILIVEYLWFRF